MLKRNCRILLAVSIIAAVIAGVITVIWWHQRHCNDAEIAHQADGTVTVEPTDGTVTVEPTDGTVIADPTDGTQFLESTDETEERYPLDDQYASSYLEATCNYERGEVNRQFAEKWRQEAELYYNKICEIAYNEDFKQAIIAGQAAWEYSYPIRVEENFAYLRHVYRAGSIVPILASKYEYDLQRERAIELYKMYEKVKVVWDIIQEYGFYA